MTGDWSLTGSGVAAVELVAKARRGCALEAFIDPTGAIAAPIEVHVVTARAG